MSEYASEEIVIPTHVEWLDPLKELVNKMLDQDCENLNMDALCGDQDKAISDLLSLVDLMGKRIDFYKENNFGWVENPSLFRKFRVAKFEASQTLIDLNISGAVLRNLHKAG